MLEHSLLRLAIYTVLQTVKAELAKAAWMEQQQPAAAGGAGSSRAAARGSTGGVGIRVDDLRRLMEL